MTTQNLMDEKCYYYFRVATYNCRCHLVQLCIRICIISCAVNSKVVLATLQSLVFDSIQLVSGSNLLSLVVPFTSSVHFSIFYPGKTGFSTGD